MTTSDVSLLSFDDMQGGSIQCSERPLGDMSVEDDLLESRRRLLTHENASTQQIYPSLEPLPGYGTFVPTVAGEGVALPQPQNNAVSPAPARSKRYRMVMLILLAFDAAIVAFLALNCFLNSNNIFQIQAYFVLDVHSSLFDLVLLAAVRFVLNTLFYLILNWVTRIVLAFTTCTSFYVPLKALYYWKYLEEDEGANQVQFILVILVLCTAFIMPWCEALFFEFKYLPAEQARLSTLSWRDWRVWCCPWMLVKPTTTTTLQQPHGNHDHVYIRAPVHSALARSNSLDTVFRTPQGSARGSPVHVLSDNDELPTIREEGCTSAAIRMEEDEMLSPLDEQYRQEAIAAMHVLEALTSSLAGWKFEKDENGIQCYSQEKNSRKIWKTEMTVEVPFDTMWKVLYDETERSPEWHPNMTKNEIIHQVDQCTDVVYSVSSAVGPISARDFVSVRTWMKKGDVYYIASAAITYEERPPQPNKVRGENGPCGYVFIPLTESSTRFIWVVDTNPKGWLPQSVIDQNFVGIVMTSNLKLRQYLLST